MSRVKPSASATAWNIVWFHSLSGLKNGNARSLKLSERSGRILLKSHSIFSPRPVHSGQAPNGLLKENRRGCKSGIEIPQSGQAFFWLKNTSSSLSPTRRVTITIPLAFLRAISIESARRLRTSSLFTIRSTTISIVCFFCLSSLIASSSSAITPSIRARTKPEALASSKIF